MLSSSFSLTSTFLLGAIHALEPGHGKSIVALETAQSRKWSEAISLLASLLLSHFLLVVVLSTVLYFHADWFDLDWIRFIAPMIILFYGLFLLIKSRKNSDEYIACSCSHTEEDTRAKKNPILIGAIAGLTPCPSVFTPIIIALSSHDIQSIFMYIVSYIAGVVALFGALVLFVLFIRKKSNIKLERLMSKFNPHLISGIMMVAIGLIYLYLGFTHS